MIIELGGWTPGALSGLLRKDGYTTKVVHGAQAAREALNDDSPLLLIVGGVASSSLYDMLRRASAHPILALAPEHDEEQMLAAYAAGVDQYQIGPIGDREVAARAHALVRRANWRASARER